MDPTVLLIIMKQGERSLEDHTRDYIFLAEHSHFPDSSLCTFYCAGLNTTTKGLLSGEGPQESLPDYIEWVLASCGSSWTIDFVKEDVSPTLDPKPSQPSPRHAEFEPEPTADDEPEPRATEQRIATEPEPNTSDQVREPATTTATVECCVEQERAMESPAHCTTAGGELELNSGDLIDFFTEVLETNSGDLIDFSTEIPTCHDLPVGMEFPPTPLFCLSGHRCPLTAPLLTLSPLPVQWAHRGSASFHRRQGWRIPQLRLQPQSPELRLGPPTLRLHHGSQRPRLHRRPSAHQLHRAPSSLRLRLGRSLSRHRLGTPLLRLCLVAPPALLGSSLPPAQPPSSVAPAPPRTSGSPPTPWSPEPRAPPWPSGSSVSPWIFGSPSPPRAPPPAAPPLSVGPLESSALPPPWLLPPSAPPWVIMAAVWVSLCFSCSGSLLFPPWLLPPSSPPWTVLFFPELSVWPWPPELPDPPWPPELPTLPPLSMLYGARRAYSEGGVMSHSCLCMSLVFPIVSPRRSV
ncbi:Transcription elongation factor spt5 [Labeo rohita]|uniref:Transcription elongation factor spt5 n=1 Tax=Labeo rohita TaxID=84645 RepID=A0ABQ8LHH1_LABRO|nr:Transcription elongation factor spt5 [Labeo rohita]